MSTEPEQDHLGLGLAIVRKTAELLGHHIGVKSTLGKGAMFFVEVPLAQAETEPAETKEVQTQIDFAGRTIVVIEDEDWQRGALSMFLESLGCQVIAARSATEAVSRVKMEGIFPDIVVSDFRLAERKTGLEAISTIRLAVGQRVPAVLVTGDTDPQRLRQAKRGGYTLLHKPFRPEDLKQALAKAFIERRG